MIDDRSFDSAHSGSDIDEDAFLMARSTYTRNFWIDHEIMGFPISWLYLERVRIMIVET
jgi:hypothetical protein